MTAESITIPIAKAGAYVATLPLSAIKIGDRFRKDHGDLDALAASIKELGLLHPIVVDHEHNLVCGHRRYLAHQLLGRDAIQARIIEVPSLLQAEHDENELRKSFTPSERVAIADAIKAEIGNRQGQRTQCELVQNFAEVTPGKKTREIAAKAAGFGNSETYRQAKIVTDKAEPEMVQAMDKGKIAISTAAKLAEADPEVQREAVANPKAAPQLAKQVTVGRNERLKFPASARRIADPGISDAEIITAPPRAETQRNPEDKESQRLASVYANEVANWLNQLKGWEQHLDTEGRDSLLGYLKAAIARIEAMILGEERI